MGTSSDPSQAQYGSQVPDTGATQSSSSSGGSGLESEIGFLPFTGLDLLIVVGVALVITGIGFMLRRLTEPRGPLA
jgi:hypothetical protein